MESEMRTLASPAWMGIVAIVTCTTSGWAQKSYNWQEVRDRFLATNPTLQAGEYSVREAKAQEITAFLRPNPEYTLSTDGLQLFPSQGEWRPFSGVQFVNSVSYL